MNIAVVGAGNFGRNHVRTLHQLGVLRAVAEQNPALRRQIAADYPDVSLHENHESLLRDPGIDAVTIATPAPTHFALGREFLEAGKDVLLEKPMTLSVREAEELVALADSLQRVLMVGHVLMYQPVVSVIANFLREGRLGRVFTLHQERAKLGKARSVENALWSLGVHDVAVLLHLVGEVPSRVVTFGHSALQSAIEDDLYVHFSFPSGIKATIHNSWLWPEDSRCLRIIGERGMLVYDEHLKTLTHLKKTVDASLNHHDAGAEVLYEGSSNPLKLEMEHFLECLRTRRVPISDGRNGVEVLRVLEEAARNQL